MRLPQRLSRRKEDSHKRDFGHVFVVAGSLGMCGAAILTAKTVLRCGAGLVTLGLPKSLVPAVVSYCPEIMTLPLPETDEGTIAKTAFRTIKDFLSKADVLMIGPGLSRNLQTQELARKVIFETRIQTVIDADAINAWIGFMDKFKVGVSCLPLPKSNLRIITPHPGELGRIMDVKAKDIQNKRRDFAKKFAEEYNAILVLKGHLTIVASPFGSLYVNKTGNSGMSTAGSGDVLDGVISAFLAQGLPSFEAAKLGAYIHGLAGDLAVKDKTQLGMIASDIIDYLPAAIKKSGGQN
ncbi:NAD(P)H-hydrate dehydratase [Candidatus Omnitrophota bacterium]